MDNSTRDLEPQGMDYNQYEADQRGLQCRSYRRMMHIADLRPRNPSDYYESLKDWSPFPSFKAPAKGPIRKSVGISLGLRIISLFNKDASARLDQLKEQAEAEYQKEVQAAREFHNSREKTHYRNQEKQHQKIDDAHDRMKHGDPLQVATYFRTVMAQDDFSTDCDNRYAVEVERVTYDQASQKLSVLYRIPNRDEILTFESFRYDSDLAEIVPTPVDAKRQQEQRIKVARKMLLRSMILIYASDAYDLIREIEVTGFLHYFDPSYGQYHKKDVLRVCMNRSQYAETDFNNVDVDLLFAHRLKAKESAGLYSKNPMELIDIHTEQKKAPPAPKKKAQKEKQTSTK